MTGVYIGSTSSRAGKSLFSFSFGVLLQKARRSVAYMKPVGRSPRKTDDGHVDTDALIVQEVLGQSAPPELLSPVMVPESLHSLTMADCSDKSSAIRRIATAYERISAGKDITLVSGTGSFPATGRFAHADGLAILRELRLKILFVERFNGRIDYDLLLLLKDMLGSDMLGVVLNDVPEQERRDAENLLVPWLESQGIRVFGLIEHEPGLSDIRIIDLAAGLGGRIVTGNIQNSGMVRGFLIGTMQVDNFMMHMRRQPGSAVIVGGDRTDLQLAALYGQSPCIILTGNIRPSELIRSRAEAGGTVLISVREDTYIVARTMAHILKSKKIRELQQIHLAVDMVEKSLNLAAVLDEIDSRGCGPE